MKNDIQLTGLENLVNKASLNETNPFNTKFISIHKLEEHELNEGRQTKETVERLKQSILDAGLLQPLLVYKTQTGNYKIISGHGRYRAIKQLKEYRFNGNTYDSDEIPVIIDREEKEELDQQINILRANAQKDESVSDKIETVRKAQELYKKLRNQNKISVADKTKKRIWISQITGYSQSSVKQYLQKINGDIEEKAGKQIGLQTLLKKVSNIHEIALYKFKEHDFLADTKTFKQILSLLEEMKVYLDDINNV